MKEKEPLKIIVLGITLGFLIASQIITFYITGDQSREIKRLKEELDFTSFRQSKSVKDMNAMKDSVTLELLPLIRMNTVVNLINMNQIYSEEVFNNTVNIYKELQAGLDQDILKEADKLLESN